jgi:hypothetical protein
VSTELPANPNLEHLKKQAKALLHDFQQKNPQVVEKFSVLRLKTAPKLSDAQRLIAREYGFDSWPKLNEHVQAAITAEAVRQVRKAFRDDDTAAFRRLLDQYPVLKAKINEPVGDFDSPLINHVRSAAMLELLLDAGADINARSRWWAGGFGLLDSADPGLAAHAIRRGAVVTVHAAARLAMLDKLKELIASDPRLVHARGGDGQTPLHFASTAEIAQHLLDHGAEIDARDVDHESTPAQYMLRQRPAVARYLVRRGCHTDILMAASLGDVPFAERLLQSDPECIRMRVSDEYFPMVGPRNGGTIYQWELGWYVSAVQVAKSFGHEEMFGLLMGRSPAEERLLNACWLHDEPTVNSLLAQDSNLAAKLPVAGRRHVAHAARNNDTAAVRLMLTADLPANTFSQHHATPLHWAAFHGNAGMIRLLLPHHPPIENDDNDYKATPLNWAMYGSQNGWHQEAGDYANTVEALLDAGASLPGQIGGTDAVKAVFGRLRPK